MQREVAVNGKSYTVILTPEPEEGGFSSRGFCKKEQLYPDF